MTQEALRMALEVNESMKDVLKQVNELIAENKALKEALAQPEPFGYFKAEPFGWTDCAETDEGAVALYQAPPQRTWVGLTDDEVAQAMYRADAIFTGPMQFKFAKEIEAKLKEKNT
jgi:hypothetical protein